MQGRYRGAVVGMAVCDALGAVVEFQKRGSFDPVEDMRTGGKFDLCKGEWTDDTSMSLLIAESLLLKGHFDPHDQMSRVAEWYDNGHLSSTGECFDIGKCTLKSLQAWRRATKDGSSTDGCKDYFGPCTEEANGNGTLMRLCPVPLAFRRDAVAAADWAVKLDKTTHGGEHAASACRAYTLMMLAALGGEGKAEVLAAYGDVEDLHPEVHRILVDRSYATKSRDDIVAGGWVVPALEAALWAFASTDSFREGALAAVNLGDDADTVAAIYGQLAGAFYGEDSIPAEWQQAVAHPTLLRAIADGLLGFAEADDTPVAAYKELHAHIVRLEAGSLRIVQRSRPGPRGFRTPAECTAAVDEFAKEARGKVPQILLDDFVHMLRRYEGKVAERCR
eukprot:TRINITY_DN10612_c0_g1_i1.p1 TRINITY_DN10612_c0_g1~~TRINITY_DN10612_c0_g1_i1.p1  ORF type:complete len:408 (+),score=105.51 TRINITY_DN10612_c0_g1_i1:53-1225(+)